ncbi:MAG: hypothetical protein WD648_01925 [Planctomycetaceae bacterium]
MKALLLLSLVLPGAAAVLLMVLRGSIRRGTARWIALGASVATLLVVMGLVREFRALPITSDNRMQSNINVSLDSAVSPVHPRFEMRREWLTLGHEKDSAPGGREFRLEMHLGLDGISIALIALTALLTVSCVLISWESIRERETEFYTCLLLLENGLIGVVCAFVVVLF